LAKLKLLEQKTIIVEVVLSLRQQEMQKLNNFVLPFEEFNSNPLPAMVRIDNSQYGLYPGIVLKNSIP